MAELKIYGQTTVRKLKEDFNKAFGLTLRVYTSTTQRAFADEKATLASLRAEGKKGGEIKCGPNKKVGNFEKEFEDLFGIGVQVAIADNSKLVSNDLTLAAASKK